MAKRKDIEIKTRYATKEECIMNLRQRSSKDVVSGDIDEDGKFKLNTSQGHGWMFEFVGNIEERKNNVYMVGDIKSKFLVNISMFLAAIICFIMAGGVVYLNINKISTIMGQPIKGGGINILMAPICAIIPCINVLILKYNDVLYKDILKKVS